MTPNPREKAEVSNERSGDWLQRAYSLLILLIRLAVLSFLTSIPIYLAALFFGWSEPNARFLGYTLGIGVACAGLNTIGLDRFRKTADREDS